jgi:YjbE family integral membrane protein
MGVLMGVVWVDLVQAGDNAIVVGMAAAGLPKDQRTKVIIIGIIAATVLRILFAATVQQLMLIIGLTLAGGILLLWVCWKMWREIRQQTQADKAVDRLEEEIGGVLPTADFDNSMGKKLPNNGPRKTFGQAALQIVIADVSMSLDNVLAIGGMTKDHPTWVLVVGLALSVAFMGIAATFIAGLLKRYHWIAYVGLLIIVYVALQMIWDGTHEVMAATDTAGLL